MSAHFRPSRARAIIMQRRLFGLLCILFSCLLSVVQAQQQPAPDTNTLLSFKQQLTADPTGMLARSWNINSLDSKGCPMNWYGVTCSSGGSVTQIVLENLGLKGEISSGTLSNLSGLLSLSLANNSLTGVLPDDFSGLSNLKSMNLSNNLFSAEIPSSLFMLPSLGSLNLAGNGFDGSIPSDVGLSLISLDLSRNQLSQHLPTSLMQLQQLASLNLSFNSLSGGFPRGFEGLVELEVIDLRGNQLSGTLDSSLLGLNKTRYIDFSSNSFTGGLPWQTVEAGLPVGFGVIEYVNLSHNQLSDKLDAGGAVFAANLAVLDISDNLLHGELPSFEFATALETLWLSHNNFFGSIPTTLLSSSSLVDLDLSGNQLTGNVPQVTAGFLKSLNLSNNNLDGSLLAAIGQCETVDMSYNNFTGDLSAMQAWGNSVQFLDLSNNQFTGLLPAANLIQFYKLNTLDLSHNMLTGVIPQPFAKSQALSVVDLSFNAFSGSVPPSLFYSTVTSLQLSHNQFTGQIPLSESPASAPSSLFISFSHFVGDATTLSPLLLLDLSSNALTSSIPPSIGSFSTLETLNLSSNRLSGPIPSQLNQLTKLQDLDLSRNNLSGPIPKGLSRFPQSDFFPGNTALQWPNTGVSPTQSSPGASSITGKKKRGGMKSSVKAGLIGGCTAGGFLVIVLGILVCLKSRRSDGSTTGSEKGFEHAHRPGSRAGSELDGDMEQGTPPSVLAGVVTGKSISSKRDWSSPTENGSPEVTADGPEMDIGDLSPSRNLWLPPVGEGTVSPEHRYSSKVSPEHPVDVKVASPEHLVGDVFFLDKTLNFSLDDLSRAPAEVLGRSSHGTSYKAILGPDHILVVKWLKEGLAKSKKEFGMEAKKFGNIKHRNIVPTKGYYWGPREHEKLILFEYIIGASLDSRLFDRAGVTRPALTWGQRLKTAVDVSRGLLHLHGKHSWAHGNIKASNILLTEGSEFEARLSDYSLHRLMTSDGTVNQILNANALGYCAPELSAARKPKPSMKSDVFSFGVILMELITGKSAGDIISGQSGIVDLPDWVKLIAIEGRHPTGCYDTALVGVARDREAPNGIDQVLALSLKCCGAQSSRPTIKKVHESLAAIHL